MRASYCPMGQPFSELRHDQRIAVYQQAALELAGFQYNECSAPSRRSSQPHRRRWANSDDRFI